MSEDRLLVVTAELLKRGYHDSSTGEHKQFEVLHQDERGDYVVKNPRYLGQLRPTDLVPHAIRHRYLHDAVFHRLVQAMVHSCEEFSYTEQDFKDAVACAEAIIAERRIRRS